MNLAKNFVEGLKIAGLIAAIALVLWTMPEQTALLTGQ